MDWTNKRANAERMSHEQAERIAAALNEDSGDVFYYGRALAKPAEAAQQNPWTPPGAHWPRYEIKVMPSESYISGSKRIVTKWRALVLKFIPGQQRPEEYDAGYGSYPDGAQHAGITHAVDLAAKEPRNPNEIRVYNKDGKCVFSTHGSC